MCAFVCPFQMAGSLKRVGFFVNLLKSFLVKARVQEQA